MIYDIVQVGHPVLRNGTDPLDLAICTTDEFKQLVEDMTETMRVAPGAGLAAPQIGKAMRFVVVDDDTEYAEEYDEEDLERVGWEPVPYRVLLNPTVTPLTDDKVTLYEGCLSVSGYRAEVERYRDVRVEGWNEHGESVSFDAHGWHARIWQHEFDHLEGTLYIDRMQTRTFSTEDNLDTHQPEEEY